MTQTRPAALLLAGLMVLGLTGCKRSEPTGASAAAGPLEVPTSFVLDVTIDGRPGDAIDASRLQSTPADFTRGEGHAWRLETFFDDRYTSPGAMLHAYDADGDGIVLSQPGLRMDGDPVLVLNQRGGAMVTLMSTRKKEEDGAHGRGGNRKRGGDGDALRLTGVTRLELALGQRGGRGRNRLADAADAKGERGGKGPRGERGDKGERGGKGMRGKRRGQRAGLEDDGNYDPGSQRGKGRGGGQKAGKGERTGEQGAELVDSGYAVRIIVGTGAAQELNTKDLEAIEAFQVNGPGGQGKVVKAWSLAEVAAKFGGPGAEVTHFIDQRGKEVRLDPGEWDTPGLVPALRVNRRGNWRFHWVDEGHTRVKGKDVRNVAEIHVSKTQ